MYSTPKEKNVYVFIAAKRLCGKVRRDFTDAPITLLIG